MIKNFRPLGEESKKNSLMGQLRSPKYQTTTAIKIIDN
jgi:hypothetical protein